VALALGAQAPAGSIGGLDLVGAQGARLVDRRAVRHRVRGLAALGAVPGYVGGVGGVADAVTFFVGSVSSPVPPRSSTGRSVRFEGPAPATRRRAWRRLATPAPGASTGGPVRAARRHVVLQPQHRQAIATSLSRGRPAPGVAPDALGSICFSSPARWPGSRCATATSRSSRRTCRWITLGNLAGSIAFGVSAVASFVVSDGQLLDAELSNLGTFVGALCFLAASIALLPERTLAPRGRRPDRGQRPGTSLKV